MTGAAASTPAPDWRYAACGSAASGIAVAAPNARLMSAASLPAGAKRAYTIVVLMWAWPM